MKQVIEFSLSLKELAWKCNSKRAACNTQQLVDAHEVPGILVKNAIK